MNVGETIKIPHLGLVYIYGVYDPADGIIRYVGQTANPHVRMSEHLRASKNDLSPKTVFYMWLRSVLQAGRMPEMIILEIVEPKQALKAERKWIKHFHNENSVFNSDTETKQGKRKKPRSLLIKKERALPRNVTLVDGKWYVRKMITVTKDGQRKRRSIHRRCDPETPQQARLVYDAIIQQLAAIKQSQINRLNEGI